MPYISIFYDESMINIFADVLVALIDYITGDFAKGHPCPFFIALLISIYIFIL